MASKISVLNTIDNVIEYARPLLDKYEVYLYIEYRDSGKVWYTLLENNVKEIDINESYSCFFLSTKLIDVSHKISFYSDEIYGYTIEGTGGRQDGDNIEQTALRMISKTPEKNIKSFFNALLNMLKKDTDYEKGVYSGAGTFYKDIFYLKSMAQSKIFWFDFKRKDKPIQITG